MWVIADDGGSRHRGSAATAPVGGTACPIIGGEAWLIGECWADELSEYTLVVGYYEARYHSFPFKLPRHQREAATPADGQHDALNRCSR